MSCCAHVHNCKDVKGWMQWGNKQFSRKVWCDNWLMCIPDEGEGHKEGEGGRQRGRAIGEQMKLSL